jgi:phosphatidylinositol alpha 1,6-mannosyltransferase
MFACRVRRWGKNEKARLKGQYEKASEQTMNALKPSYQSPRVALFSGNYNYLRDGANQALNRLVDYLERQHVAVRVYSPTAAVPAFAHSGQVVSVPSVSIPRRREYRFALGLPRAVREDLAAFRPNLFHLSAPDYLGYKALKLAQSWNIPAVASVHTRFETYFRYYGFGWAEKLAGQYLHRFYGQCAQIYAPTESMAQVLRDERMNPDIRIWSRGIDSALFHPGKRDEAWRGAHGIGPAEVVVAFVGRLVLEKGLAVFADSIDQARARGMKLRVLVVGDGPERAWFAERLPGAVFTGFLQGPDLARAYASSDIFFNPSTTETFGNVTLEAMASGLPALCARATGSMSLVVHGATGFLCESHDIGEYADCLVRLISDAGLRRGLGAASRQRSLVYNWDRILSDVLTNYREVLGLAPASAPGSAIEPNELAVAV